MTASGGSRIRRRALVFLALACAAPASLWAAVPPPASAPAAGSAASAPAAKKPTVDEILARRKPMPFDFTDVKVTDIMDYVARSYDIDIHRDGKYELDDKLTFKQSTPLSARDAIDILDGVIISKGYTLVESVVNGRVVLTLVPTRVDSGRLVQVYSGNDPRAIPEDDSRRTQVFSYTAVDPETARNMIVAVVGKQAELEINASNKTIVITDTGTHVHTAAMLLQELERQAAAGK